MTDRIPIYYNDKLRRSPSYRGILVKCGNGHICSINNHTIEDNGDVNPSLVCPKCEWHHFVTLVGWRKKSKARYK